MRQLLLRAVALLRRPLVLVTLLVLSAGGTALAWAPLVGVPGYDLASVLTVAIGLLGGGIGIAAAKQEQRLIQGVDPRPPKALRVDDPLDAVGLAVGAACLLTLGASVPPLVASVARTLATSDCNPFWRLEFFLWLPLPSSALAAAAGVFCGLSFRRAGVALVAYLGLLLVSGASTAWPIIKGPQVFAYNHFLGYLPGPLYDEVFDVRPALLWFRAQSLLLCGLFWSLSALMLDMKSGGLGFPRIRPLPLLMVVAMMAGIVSIEDRATTVGFRMSHEVLATSLGGRRESAHFVLHYYRGKRPAEVERLLRDLEFRHAQLEPLLGAAPEKIRVFLYRSAVEKQGLVGAARTQFAKPWLRELHLNDAPFPHPVLKHELAHVMAAPHGSGYFQVTTGFGVWPHMGIIEGLAVAADDPIDSLSLHEWSAGMKRSELLPNVRTLLSPQGFYQQAPARAYTAAGSFLRYLAEAHGPAKVRALYAHGDFQAAFGTSLDSLASEWERFLDTVALDETQRNQAFARFRSGSLFARACAREVATLQAEASTTLTSDPEHALELYGRCARLQPKEPLFVVEQARALALAGRRTDLADYLKKTAGQLEDAPSARAELELLQADLAFQMGELEQARGLLESALSRHPQPGVDRVARLKLLTLESKAVGGAVWSYLRPERALADEAKLLTLRESLELDPKNPAAAYLLGRRLAESAPDHALKYLDLALAGELPEELRRETLRLKVAAEYLSGDCEAVAATVSRAPDVGPAFRGYAEEWTARCRFEKEAFQGPLVPGDAFR